MAYSKKNNQSTASQKPNGSAQKNRSEYDNNLKIALWESTSDNEKAPVLSGHVTIEGVEYRVALWYPQSDNPKAPALSGKLTLVEPEAAPF